jgi:hypothetical protein
MEFYSEGQANSISGVMEIDDFGLKINEVSVFSVQVSGLKEAPAVWSKILCLLFLTPETCICNLKLDRQTHIEEKKRRPCGRPFFSTARVKLYLGVDPLFEDELLVLLELVTVLQALVLILADHLTS